MATTPEPTHERIDVTLGPDAGTRGFETLDDLQKWLNAEKAFWGPLILTTQIPRDLRHIPQKFEDFFFAISELLAATNDHEKTSHLVRQNILDLTDEGRKAEFRTFMNHLGQKWATVQNTFTEHYIHRNLISSSSAKARFCLSLFANESPVRALSALGYFMRMPIATSTSDHFYGAVAAYCFEQGITPRTPAETELLSELRRDWNAQFQSLKDDLQEQAEEQSNLNAQLSKQLADQTSQFNSLLLKQKDDWAALHKAYDSSLALRKPVRFWANKAKSHCIQGWLFGLASLSAAGGVFGLIYHLIQITLRPPANSPASWHPEYWRISVLIASAVFGVWVIRIFVRLFLSHVHLHSDAKERVTMALTYLSLLRSDKTMTAKERDLILHALFRQAATGVVKDDGIPLAAVEYLTRTGK